MSDSTDLPDRDAAAKNPAGDDNRRRIALDDFLKTGGFVGTGGQAKLLIQSGDVKVNGQPETRRRRKLQTGDVIEWLGQRIVVQEEEQGQ